MKCIIPAAGFGTRMGMHPTQSKEMIQTNEPYRNGLIIDYAIDICLRHGLDPLVITRKEKTDLIKYLDYCEIESMIYKPKKGEEWNDTVLASEDHWQENNLLLLPDTRFKPHTCIKDIQRGLDLGNNAVMALHEAIDPSKWGIITPRYVLLEKPDFLPNEMECWAWGLIGFKKSYGQELFYDIKCNKDLKNVGFTYLNGFEDITRGNK